MTASFGLKNWHERVVVNGDGEDCRRAGLERQSGLGLRCPLHTHREMLNRLRIDTSRVQDPYGMDGHINMGIISI